MDTISKYQSGISSKIARHCWSHVWYLDNYWRVLVLPHTMLGNCICRKINAGKWLHIHHCINQVMSMGNTMYTVAEHCVTSSNHNE